jgi:hypothetical protein
VHFARFRCDTANWQKGEPPGSPFAFRQKIPGRTKFSAKSRAVFPEPFEVVIQRLEAAERKQGNRRQRVAERWGLMFRRAFVMMAVVPDSAVSAVVAIM